MKEKDFQSEYKRSLNVLEGPVFYHKIVDTGFIKNPFDCFVLRNSTYYACELKMSKIPTRIDIQGLFRNREHEIDSLRHAEECGGIAFVLVNVRLGRSYNKVYAWRIEDYMNIYDYNKSIKLEDVMNYDPIVIEKIKHPHGLDPVWDLSLILR